MECNKDEATRAKEIAENKFTAKDIFGARKFALKAQNLFPGLDCIPQMLTTLEVYISARNKINGEADWYGILGVDPFADDGTLRKQYRKLALTLHPDKNKSIGADGAFKLISEAWSLLSDKSKRLAYDKKINAKAHKASFSANCTQTRATGSYSFTKTTASRDQQNFNHQVPGKRKSNSKKNIATPNAQWCPFSRTSGLSSVAQAANVVQQAYGKVKREREEEQAAMKREEALRRKQHAGKNSYSNPTKRRRGHQRN